MWQNKAPSASLGRAMVRTDCCLFLPTNCKRYSWLHLLDERVEVRLHDVGIHPRRHRRCGEDGAVLRDDATQRAPASGKGEELDLALLRTEAAKAAVGPRLACPLLSLQEARGPKQRVGPRSA